MKTLSSILLLLLLFFHANAQITARYKPGPVVGEDAGIMTTYGCTTRWSTVPAEFSSSPTGVELLYSDWTYSAGGCPHGTIRALLRFAQMDTIPVSAVIISAELKLFGVTTSSNWGTSTFPGSPYPLSNEAWVQRVTGSWSEATVTWNTQPTTTTVNQATLTPTTARWGWVKSADVTDIVKDIRTTGVNDGFMLRLQTEAYYRAAIFSSSDGADSTLWPELIIKYRTECKPFLPPFTATRSSCFGVDFDGVGPAGGISSWYWTFGDGGTSPLQSVTHTFPDYGMYTVKLVAADGSGCTDSVTQTITIAERDFANAGKDTTVCLINGKATVQLSASGGKSYLWSSNVPDLVNPAPVVTINGSTRFIVTVTDSIGCTDKDTVYIAVRPGTPIQVTPQDTTACTGAIIQLTASGASSYQWFPPTGLSDDKISNPQLTIGGGSIDYIVTATDASGCTSSDTVHIGNYPLPPVWAYTDEELSCTNTKVRLHASGASSYQWYPGVYCDNDLSASPLVWPPSTIVFTVTGTDERGCQSADTVLVRSRKELTVHVPNAFTPNGDGINDYLRPIIICNFQLEQFNIYNRWGQCVFQTSSAAESWDGLFKSVPAEVGVYYYMLQGKMENSEEEVLIKGDITLVR